MQVFISFSRDDAAFAARLERALRNQKIDTWSSLDLRGGEDWVRAVNEASAKADAFIFLLRAGTPSDPHAQIEWRNMLRNDWESKKTLIPIALTKKLLKRRIPPFLRNRKLLSATDFDKLVERLVYLLQHPAESRDHRSDEKDKQEQIRRLEELREFALALKDAGNHSESRAERQ